MCIYIRTIPLCGHPPPTLLSYTSCTNVFAQLMRITEPEAWGDEVLDTIPFDMPDDCDPRPGNIWTLYSDDYCGWECRNNAYLVRELERLGANDFGGGELAGEGEGGLLPAYIPGDERGQYVLGQNGGCFGAVGVHKMPMVMGMPDARYGPGSERLGIGWRSEE